MPRRSANSQRKPSAKVRQPTPTAAQQVGEITPLAYLLSVIRDSEADPRRRDRAAIAAAQYCHPRLAEKTRKAQAAEAAEQAGGSRWGNDLAADDWPQ